MPQIEAIAARAHTIILGGDIFDFKWSTRPSLAHSIDAAVEWVKGLMESNPSCAVYYLLGNHDAHPSFVAELDRLAFENPRLVWQPYVLRLGKCVFLHGDVVDGDPAHSAIEARRRASDNRPFPKLFRHWIYDAIVKARLHRVAVHVAKRQETVLKRLNYYLVQQGLDASSGVTDVYFGHTHRDMDCVSYKGLNFHNGGASIKGLEFRIIETCLELP